MLFRSLILSIVMHSFQSEGFVLLSGANEAILDASPEDPTVTIVWDESSMSVEEKEKLAEGQYADLSEIEFMERMLRIAMDIWNNVPGSFVRLNLVRDSTADLNSEDGVHTIAIRDSSNLSTSATALPIVEKNRIIDCDISINRISLSATSLTYTIAHELGHCLGLGHAHTNYDAIMGYSRSDKKIRLGADDMAGLIYLYPDPAYGDRPPLPIKCSTISPSLNSSQSLPWFIFGLPLLIALLGLINIQRLRPHWGQKRRNQ